MKTGFVVLGVLLSCFLQILPAYGNSGDLLGSWKKITENNANDIQQSNKIYSKIIEEQRALVELHTVVERHLKTKNAEILVNALSANNITTSEHYLKYTLDNINDNYEKQMVDSIFVEAIEKLITMNNLPALPDLLWQIYLKNDSKSFEMMVRAQLQLYNIFAKKHYVDKRKFLHQFANRMYKIRKDPMFNDTSLALKLHVHTVVEQLPNNLKYLYFMPYFCLLNVRYSTYIYTAVEQKVDPLSRYIWLWHDSSSMDDKGYIKAEISDFDANSGNGMNILLKGTKYQMFYYMIPSTKEIAGWDSETFPSNNVWTIEFLDNDRVVFSQEDYLMCALENHDRDRRNVGGLKRSDNVSSMTHECQWRLGECAFGRFIDIIYTS